MQKILQHSKEVYFYKNCDIQAILFHQKSHLDFPYQLHLKIEMAFLVEKNGLNIAILIEIHFFGMLENFLHIFCQKWI